MVKALMKIVFGGMCLALWYATKSPLKMLEEKKYSIFHSEPSAEFGIFSMHWIAFICGVGLIIIGLAEVIKQIWFRKIDD